MTLHHRRLARETRLFGKAVRYMRCNNKRRLFYLLTQSPELLNWLDDGHTLLCRAAWWRRYDIAEWLLSHGADPDLVHDGGNTPLVHAACENDERLARMLLDFGANIEYQNDRFETPLGFACAWDAVDVVRLLCERGANVNGTEGWGKSYLYGVQCESATKPQQAEIERILLSYGARVIQEAPKLKEDQ